LACSLLYGEGKGRYLKKKILFLFLLLSVTPFIRGCGETFGFPLPAMDNIIEPGSLSATWDKLLAALASLRTLALVLANIIFAAFFARIFIRNAGRLKWILNVMTALAIGLAMIWVMTAIFLLDINIDSPATVIEKVATIYGNVFSFIYYTAPRNASKALLDAYPWGLKEISRFIKKDAAELTFDDVFNRAWFVVVTFAGGWALHAASILRRKKGRR